MLKTKEAKNKILNMIKNLNMKKPQRQLKYTEGW